MFTLLNLYRVVVSLFLLTLPSLTLGEETALTDAKAQVGEPKEEKFTGRVVLASNPEQGVASIGVSGHAIGINDYENQWRFHGRTDKDGYFSGPKISERSYLTVVDSAQLRGAIQILEPNQTDIVLSLAPTASIQGTVFDAQNNVPAARHRVEANVVFSEDQRWRNSSLRRKGYTDDKGKFLIEGLVPGFNYQLTSKSPDSEYYFVGPVVGHIKPSSAERIVLDDLQIPKTYPTPDEFIASRYLNKPPEERLKYGLNYARLASIRLLMIAAERDSDAAKQFYGLIDPYGPGKASTLASRKEFSQIFRQFIPLSLAPSESGDFLKWHGINIPESEDATFAIFGEDGRVAQQISFEEVQVGGKFSPELLEKFLENHLHPPLGNARELLDTALAKAKKENKRVFVQTGGPGCGPCVILSSFLEKHEALIEKDYVNVKLDTRMESFMEVYEKLTAGEARGAPWMTILSADGKTLITGDDEEGNIGFPTDESEIAQFKKMFASTKQTISDQEIDELVQSLSETGKELLSKQEK
jgi:hypothetical protein